MAKQSSGKRRPCKERLERFLLEYTKPENFGKQQVEIAIKSGVFRTADEFYHCKERHKEWFEQRMNELTEQIRKEAINLAVQALKVAIVKAHEDILKDDSGKLRYKAMWHTRETLKVLEGERQKIEQKVNANQQVKVVVERKVITKELPTAPPETD